MPTLIQRLKDNNLFFDIDINPSDVPAVIEARITTAMNALFAAPLPSSIAAASSLLPPTILPAATNLDDSRRPWAVVRAGNTSRAGAWQHLRKYKYHTLGDHSAYFSYPSLVSEGLRGWTVEGFPYFIWLGKCYNLSLDCVRTLTCKQSNQAPRHGILTRGGHQCLAHRILYDLEEPHEGGPSHLVADAPDSHLSVCTVSLDLTLATQTRIATNTRPRSDTTEVRSFCCILFVVSSNLSSFFLRRLMQLSTRLRVRTTLKHTLNQVYALVPD